MAIRQVLWTVGADCKSVTPAAPQDGGVQGEDGATQVVFDLTAAPALTSGELTLYIECVDALGGYDKTAPLPVIDGNIAVLVPLCWTQYGGITTLRLVGEREGVVVYTLTGRLRFASRQMATARQVDTLLRTHIQQTLDAVDLAQQQAQDAASQANHIRNEALSSAEQAYAFSESAADSARNAQEKVQYMESLAEAMEKRLQTFNQLDDTTIRRDGTWTSLGIVDRLCPPFTQEGGLVCAYPMPDYPLEVKATSENLIPYPYAGFGYGQFNTYTLFGITYTDNGDGSVTVNGTASDDSSMPLIEGDNLIGVKPGDTVTLMGCPEGGSLDTYYIGYRDENSADDTGSGAEITLNDTFVIGLSIFVKKGVTVENLVFRPYIGKGVTITHCGKNLWDFKTGVQKVTVTTNKNGDRVEYFGYAVHLPPGKYTLHADRVSGTTARYIYGDVNGADGAHKADVNIVAGASATTKTVTITEGDVLYIYNGNTSSTEDGSNNIFKEYNVQIECGATATPYEPYTGIRVPVAPDETVTIRARGGCNCVYADTDAGTVTVTGRLDLVHILQTLMGGET